MGCVSPVNTVTISGMKDSPRTAMRRIRTCAVVGHFLLLCFGLPLATSGAAEPNRQAPLRIGIMEPIDGSGVPLDRIGELRRSLIRADGSAGYSNRIRLIRCTDRQVDSQHDRVAGACGQSVTVPARWVDSDATALYRGVVTGHWRPMQQARRDHVTGWHQEITSRGDEAPLHFTAEDLPSDMLLCKTGTDTWLGCDWNADLTLTDEEIIRLGSDGHQRYTLAATSTAAVLVQTAEFDATADEHGNAMPAMIEIELWTPTSRVAAREDGLVATVLDAVESEDAQLVWIDCGQQAHPSANGAIGPADLAVAFDAATRHECDFVVIDLRRSKMEPTQAAKLIARLSGSANIPALVNQPTIVSPQYMVEPHLQSTPDLAEVVFDTRHGHDGLGLAIERMVQRVHFESTNGAENKSQPAESFRAVVDIATEDVLREVDDDHQASDASGLLVARVPTDAITGSPRGPHRDLFDLNHHQTTRFYDPAGWLVTNPRPRGGGSVKGSPLIEAARSSGGFVTLQRHELQRNNRRKTEENTEAVGLDFVRGREPVLQLRADSADPLRQIRLIGPTDLSDTLDVEVLSYLRRLELCETDEVPQAVLASADGLRERSPRVQSWWYRSVPWPGGNSGQFVFQDHTGATPLFDDGQLQLWSFWNQGTPSRDSDMLGELGAANNWVQWLLVETVMLDDQHAQSAPVLIQCMPHHQRNAAQAAAFRRISHRAATAVGKSMDIGETDNHATEWVDDYEGRLHLGHDRLLEHADWIWAGLYEAEPNRRLVRWLKIERPDIHLAGNAAVGVHSEYPSWWPYYRDDVVAGEIRQRRVLGQSPQTVLERVSDEIPANTKDVLSLRRLLLSLDQPEIRKQHLDRVVSAADRVVDQCRRILDGLPCPVDPAVQEMLHSMGSSAGVPVAGSTGAPLPGSGPPPEPFRLSDSPASLQAYAWAVDAMYRRVRAIGYRELPDVVAETPIADQQAQDKAFERAYFQLAGMVDLDHPDFVLVRVRHQRRAGHPVNAYEHLQKYAAFDDDPYWYFKKARDLWDDMELGLPQRLGHARWFLRQLDAPLPTE